MYGEVLGGIRRYGEVLGGIWGCLGVFEIC